MVSSSSPENQPPCEEQRSLAKQSGVVSKTTHDKDKTEDDYDFEGGEADSATSDEATDKQATDDIDDAFDEVDPEEGISPMPRVSHRTQRCFARKERGIKLGSLLARQVGDPWETQSSVHGGPKMKRRGQ
ncbi:hypothetical protein U1Q18_042141 [Sarracenia purpurea var. burkii]